MHGLILIKSFELFKNKRCFFRVPVIPVKKLRRSDAEIFANVEKVFHSRQRFVIFYGIYIAGILPKRQTHIPRWDSLSFTQLLKPPCKLSFVHSAPSFFCWYYKGMAPANCFVKSDIIYALSFYMRYKFNLNIFTLKTALSVCHRSFYMAGISWEDQEMSFYPPCSFYGWRRQIRPFRDMLPFRCLQLLQSPCMASPGGW